MLQWLSDSYVLIVTFLRHFSFLNNFFSSVFGHFIAVCYHFGGVTERRWRRCPSPSQESRGWPWSRGWRRASWRRSSAGCPDGQPGPEPLGTNRWYVHLWDRYNRKRRTIRCLIIRFFMQWVPIATPRSDPSLQKEQTEPREKFGNILYWNVI